MGKPLASASIALGNRRPGVTLTQWLYEELRSAILNGRLKRGARLPATRELAAQYQVSRRRLHRKPDRCGNNGKQDAARRFPRAPQKQGGSSADGHHGPRSPATAVDPSSSPGLPVSHRVSDRTLDSPGVATAQAPDRERPFGKRRRGLSSVAAGDRGLRRSISWNQLRCRTDYRYIGNASWAGSCRANDSEAWRSRLGGRSWIPGSDPGDPGCRRGRGPDSCRRKGTECRSWTRARG